jgi:tetratricopeptide (TPR) repeat protein
MINTKVTVRKWLIGLGIAAGCISSYAAGLPGEYLLSQQWRDALARYSPLTNAAYLSNAEYIGVQLSQAFTVDNTYKLTEGSFVMPFHKHTFALTYEGVGAGELENTSVVEGPGTFDISSNGKLSDRSNSFLLSYAYNVWNGLSVGINGHVIYNDILGKKMIGYGGDIGVSYAIVNDSAKGSHVVGLSTQNLVIAGDVEYAGAATVSYLGRMFENKLDLELYLSVKDFLAQVESFSSGSDKSMEFDVAFKAGTWLFNFLKIYGQVGNEYWGATAGVNAPSLNKGRDLTVLYQFMMPFEAEYPSHSIFARSEFGDPRKEKVAKAAKEKISGIPYDLYNKAMKLYSDGIYWDAYFVFAKILVEYPKFIKNDFISLYSGECLEKLDIRDAAAGQYQRAMIKYPKSKIHPFANMGIMNIYYRQDNASGVDEMFKLLSGPHTIDSLRYHAHYLQGETFIKDKKYVEAVDVLSKIPPAHMDYIYARHSMAVCAVMQDNYQAALGYMKDCLSAKTNSAADEELMNRTYLFTGYLFHEEKEFPNALASLQMVPKSSIYYEDALLGIGWIALRAKKWDDCTAAGQNLVSIATSEVNKAEGELLQAYVNMMNKDYNSAATSLQSASGRLSTLAAPSQADLDRETDSYKTIRDNYEKFGKDVEEIASHKQEADTIEAIDSLHIDQNEFVREIGDKFKYFDTWRRQSYFARNIGVVREDVEYALARVLKMISQKQMQKEVDKSEKKEDKLDKEIEQLKKQMEKKK